MRLAFSNFGEVVDVFKGRHKFNKSIRNGRRLVEIFPAGEDPAILPRKITFHGRIQRDILFAEKVVLCYRCKTRHMLGENCPVVTPTAEDSGMSLAEQSDAAFGGAAPAQQESSVEIQPSAESQQASSPISEGAEEGDSSGEDGSGSGSDSGSTSESDDEDEPDLGPSAGPDVPSETSPDLPPRENLPVIQGAHADQAQGSQELRTVLSSKENQTKKKPQSPSLEIQGSQNKNPTQPLKSLMFFPYPEIFYRWYRQCDEVNIFRETIAELGIKGNEKYINSLVRILTIAADVIRETNADYCDKKRYKKIITEYHNSYFSNTPLAERPPISKFDNCLCSWAAKIWPRALDIIREYECGRR